MASFCDSCCIQAGTATKGLCRLRCKSSLLVQVLCEKDLIKYMDWLKSVLLFVVLNHGDLYLSSQSDGSYSAKFIRAIQSSVCNQQVSAISVLFSGTFGGHPLTPTIQITSRASKLLQHRIKINVVCNLPSSEEISNVHSYFCSKISNFLESYLKAVLFYWVRLRKLPSRLLAHQYIRNSDIVVIFYPPKEDKELELEWRKSLHNSEFIEEWIGLRQCLRGSRTNFAKQSSSSGPFLTSFKGECNARDLLLGH